MCGMVNGAGRAAVAAINQWSYPDINGGEPLPIRILGHRRVPNKYFTLMHMGFTKQFINAWLLAEMFPFDFERV